MEACFKPLFLSFAFCLLGMSMLWSGERVFAAAVQDGLLPNGDFEAFPDPSSLNGTVIVGDFLPNWRIQGTVEYIRAGQDQGPMVLVVPQGKHAVRLGNNAQISQEIEVDRGSIYSLTFSSARTCAQLEKLNVSVPPAVAESIDLQTLYNSEGWDAYAWGFKAAADKIRVVFMNPGLEEDPICGPLIDAVAIKKIVVPRQLDDNNLVLNGNFEVGPYMFPNSSLGVLFPPNLKLPTSPLPSWTFESTKAVRYIDYNHFSVPEGKRAIQLLSGKEGSISQSIKTQIGKTYSLEFLLGDGGDDCYEPLAVMAFAGDQSMVANYSSTISESYQSFNLTFRGNAENASIVFYSVYYNIRTVDNSSLCGPVIDQVKVRDINLAEVNHGYMVGFHSRLVWYANILAMVLTVLFV